MSRLLTNAPTVAALLIRRAALTGLRHAGTITGRSNLNATLAATTTADTVVVKTTEYQKARYA